MKTSFKWHLAVLAVGLAVPTAAFSLEAGTREVPAKEILVPAADVSLQEQSLIGAPLPPFWNDHPKDAAAWKLLINTRADQIIKTLPGMREKFGVKSEQVTIAGVNCYILTPDNIPEQNRNRLLVHVHGGGYVFAPAESATREAILMAGFGKFKVISIDYRMPPDFPYPAAMDDARDGAARQDGRTAAACRHGARHPMVGHDQDWRHLLHQREGRQHPGEQRRLARRCREALCQRP